VQATIELERVFRRKTLANIKSQIKRNKQNEKRRLRNRGYRGSARIAVREARSAMASDNSEEARTSVLHAISALDKAAEKGVIHKNNAARRKGRLMKRLASLDIDLKSTKGEITTEEKGAGEAEEKSKKKSAAKK
jgi:small subunit ribosomal protein S20